MLRCLSLRLFLLPFLFLLSVSGIGQKPCGVAPAPSPDAQPNIFSAQQEMWLGEAMADSLEADYKLVRDSTLDAHLQEIVDRLAAQLPNSQMKFRVLLVESPEINGFSLAGGHIYLTRRLAASALNDDELAAVLGHEMGHIASHQFAFETTRDLKRLLNVTNVSDRADVYDKYQKLMTAWLRDKHRVNGDSDDKQGEADKLGVYLVASAGYRPQAASEIWNRVLFVGGKTGNQISDFFRITKPNEKRLRGMLQMAAALPTGCGGTYTSDQHAFEAWRDAVTANRAKVKEAAVENATKVKLDPPLRADLWYLRFSRDGKMLLAQDGSSVFVLGMEPFAPLVRFDAENALEAQFSPDGQRISFSTPALHTEEWRIADKKMVSAHEPNTKHDCLQTKLSPDGRTVVCVSLTSDGFALMLELVDVQTGGVIYTKNPFFVPTYGFFLALEELHGMQAATTLVPMSFTPDGNILLIGPADKKLAFDLRTRTPLKIGGELDSDTSGSYAFTSNTTLAQTDAIDPKKSGLVSFPDGHRIKKLSFSFTDMRSLSNDDGTNRLLVSPMPGYKWGVADLDSGKFAMGVRTDAVDMRNGMLAWEALNGNIQMGKFSNGSIVPTQKLTLPDSPLGHLNTISVSRDGKYVALSSDVRGGVWDTETGKQITLTRAFGQSSWSDEGKMYGVFTKVKTPEEIAEDNEKAKAKVKTLKPKDGERVKDERHFVVEITPSPKDLKTLAYSLDNKKEFSLGVLFDWQEYNEKKSLKLSRHDAKDDSVMWTKDFPDGFHRFTQSYGEKDLIFNFLTTTSALKARIKSDSALAAEAAAIKHKDLSRLIEIVDQTTGKTEAEVVLELPLNFSGTQGLNRAGDLLYVTGDDNRTMAYSLKTGKEVREFFGWVLAIDPPTGNVCTMNRRDEAAVYDAAGKELAHYHLGSPVKFAHFKPGGTKLVFVTADQTVWTTSFGVETAAK